MKDDPRTQMRHDGYCVFEQVMSQTDLHDLQTLARRCVADITPEHRARYRAEGSLVLIAEYPEFAPFVNYAPSLAAFARAGLEDVRFSSGYVISKPPAGPPLFWHQDWWGWDHPVSFDESVMQFFAFYYLRDTEPGNGCLRVIPGSHRKRHPLHDVTDAHQRRLALAVDLEDPAFRGHPDEVDVPVRAGDLVIGDARLLHGAHANLSDAERTLLTLWYHPGYHDLPAPIAARIQELYRRRGVDTDPEEHQQRYPDTWPQPWRDIIAPLCPTYAGDTPPQPWNRTPANLR